MSRLRRLNLSCTSCFALFLVSACSTGGGMLTGDGGWTGDGGSTSSSQANEDSAVAPTDSPHNPTVGCRQGYAACGSECASLETDRRHCGACGVKCLATQGCVRGECSHDAGPVACGGPFIDCEGTCVEIQTPDDCGSCGNRCGSARVCHRSQCMGTGGAGASCDAPLVLPQEQGSFSFRFEGLAQRAFACGPLQPIDAHVFRWTAPRTGAVAINAASNGTGSRYVREIFSASSCTPTSSIGCAEDVWTKFTVQAGSTYFITVGALVAGTPAETVYLTFNY